jgi:DNA-binding CsgD family transcriptional regulator
LKVLLVEHPEMQQALMRVVSELRPELRALDAMRYRNVLAADAAAEELDLVLLVRRPACESDAGSSAKPDVPELTQRQQQVLALLLQGKPNKLISRELGLAQGTVKIHVTAILKKLKVVNRTQAVLAASRFGLALKEPDIAPVR